MSLLARGSCLCGAVAFSAKLPARWVAHCHCTRCQRAHGAPLVTWAGFLEADVEIASPDGALRWFETAEGAGRGFCGHCGSPMFFRSPRYPGELHIARALFHTALEQLPSCNAFFSSHVPWAVDAHRLPSDPEPV
ncbi:GFA family protein [Hydrogenophaga sp. RWCD_12]|uniref:GFA family protein n=1 Tax=Hydrogenophaga sp. RWCD_12 TaxID=3391190 RepID=UPI003984BF29